MHWPPSDRGIDVHTVGLDVPVGGGPVISFAARLLGWVLNIPADVAPTAVQLFNGTAQTSDLIGSVIIPAGGDSIRFPSLPGIAVDSGLLIVCTAHVTGSIFLGMDA